MAALFRLELEAAQIAKLRSVLHYNGLPIDARSVTDDILRELGVSIAKTQDIAGGSGIVGGE